MCSFWRKQAVGDEAAFVIKLINSLVCRFISDEGLKKLNENGAIGDVKELTKRAKDVSIRTFWGNYFEHLTDFDLGSLVYIKSTKPIDTYLALRAICCLWHAIEWRNIEQWEQIFSFVDWIFIDMNAFDSWNNCNFWNDLEFIF